MKITSTAFEDGGIIPKKYTCDGKNINPPLHIENIPKDAQSLAIIVEDPDAPSGIFCHWVVWNIPIQADVKEDSTPGKEGITDFRKKGYGGPCPPSGTHHYHFKVYALDNKLDLNTEITAHDLKEALDEQLISYGELIGTYSRVK